MQHDALLPRPPGGLAPGAALALLVHGGLLAALTLGVSWRMKAPEVISAELWAAVPQVAAPRVEAPAPPPPAPAPAPPPPKPAPPPPREAAPTEAQIAIERAEKRKLEKEKKEEAEKLENAKKKKAEAEAADKKKRDAEAAQAAQKKADAERLEKAREEQIKRMLSGLPATGAPTSTGTAAQSAAPSQAYVGRLVAAIKANVIFPDSIAGNPAAEVEVTTGASGTILSRRLVKKSGNDDWDEAVLRAIDRTGTLPLDNGRSPPSITITFRPKE